MLRVVVVVLLAACRPLPPQFPGGAREHVEVESGHVLVVANANGKPLTFVVDTGASITSITPAAAKRLGIAPTSTTQIGGLVVGTGTLRELVIAGLAHGGVRVAIIEMAEARRLHRHIDGIIGLDVIAQHDIVIDFARKELVLHPSGALASSPIAAEMARCDLTHGPHGLIMLDVNVDDGRSLPAVLDLGAPVSYFNRAAVQLLGKPPWVVRRQRLAVGDVSMRLSITLVEDLALFTRIGHGSTPAMMLGSDVFEHRALAIGYRDRVAFLSR